MQYGTRNRFEAKVTGIKKGGVMCQVEYDIAGGNKMSSVITCDSADALNLEIGNTVELIVKAINVIPVKK